MDKKVLESIVALCTLIMLSGCSVSGGQAFGSLDDALASAERNNGQVRLVGAQSRIKTIVGTKQEDAKVIVNSGKVLKVMVFPYKQSRTLITAHDVYTMVETPSFIVGEMVPSGRTAKQSVACEVDNPYVVKDKYLQTVTPEKESLKKKKKKKLLLYDGRIIDYIK